MQRRVAPIRLNIGLIGCLRGLNTCPLAVLALVPDSEPLNCGGTNPLPWFLSFSQAAISGEVWFFWAVGKGLGFASVGAVGLVEWRKIAEGSRGERMLF